MTENENDKQTESAPDMPPPPPVHPLLKIWRWTIWGLRWLGVIVFSVMFFLGVYMKIPTKMLICLAIFPIVGIFFPPKVRSWVWVCLTGIVLGIFIWILLPEMNQQDWKAYQFDDELEQILVSHNVPDPNNAAIIYRQVLAEYDETIFDIPFMTGEAKYTMEFAWDPNEHKVLDFWLTLFEPGMKQLRQATDMPECRFVVPCNKLATDQQLKRNNQLKAWVRLLIRSANRDLFLGNKQEALDKYLAGLSLSRHLYQQQTLFGQSGGFEIELLVTRAFQHYIIEYCDDPETLALIVNAIDTIDPNWARCWPEILLREKLITKNIVALFYQVNKEGNIRMSRNVIPDLITGLGYRPQRIFVEQEQMSKVGTVLLWLSLPMSPEKVADMIDERFDYYSLQIQKGERLPEIPLDKVWIIGMNCESVVDWMAMQCTGYYWALDGQFKRHESIVNVIHVFAALKRYYLQKGGWPDELDILHFEDPYRLTDPLNSKPYVYKNNGDNFVLYSMGSNGVDDGGLNDYDKNMDDIMIWPRTINLNNKRKRPAQE